MKYETFEEWFQDIKNIPGYDRSASYHSKLANELEICMREAWKAGRESGLQTSVDNCELRLELAEATQRIVELKAIVQNEVEGHCNAWNRARYAEALADNLKVRLNKSDNNFNKSDGGGPWS